MSLFKVVVAGAVCGIVCFILLFSSFSKAREEISSVTNAQITALNQIK